MSFSLVEGDRQSIGGSDWSDILNIKPYGCRRRALYRIGGHLPDADETQNKYQERGTVLEAVIDELYRNATGNETTRNVEFKGDKEYQVINVDAIATGSILVEYKTMGKNSWDNFLDKGLPKDYKLQVQWYLLITKLEKAHVCVLWPDGWEVEIEEIDADKDLHKTMLEAADYFWEQVKLARENPDYEWPDRLPAGSWTCWECPFRNTCWKDAPEEDVEKFVEVDDKELFDLGWKFHAKNSERKMVQRMEDALKDQIKESMKRYGDKIILTNGSETITIDNTTRFKVDKTPF